MSCFSLLSALTAVCLLLANCTLYSQYCSTKVALFGQYCSSCSIGGLMACSKKLHICLETSGLAPSIICLSVSPPCHAMPCHAVYSVHLK